MAKQPHLLVEPGETHDVALLPGDPGRVDRIANHCDDAETVAANREYKLVNAVYGDRELTICSTGIGSPSAAIAVEELAAVGVERFVRVGTAGTATSSYRSVVPSSLAAPVTTTVSPISMSGWRAPVVPTRTNRSTPTAASSSTAMAADGEPMPVEQIVSSRSP